MPSSVTKMLSQSALRTFVSACMCAPHAAFVPEVLKNYERDCSRVLHLFEFIIFIYIFVNQ